MVKLGEVGSEVWDQIILEMEKKLVHLQWKRPHLQPDWRKLAHRRKLDREMYEKYGQWKDIILDPRFQMVKHYLQENVDVQTIMSEPFIPWSTAVIILFMLNKRVNFNVLIFAAMLMFNVNPLYAALVTILLLVRSSSGNKPQPKHLAETRKKSSLRKELKASSSAVNIVNDLADMNLMFDHVLVGSDFATIYTAALLAKCGQRCCVLQPHEVDSVEAVSPNDDSLIPVPIVQCVVTKPEKYQMLLDLVQPLDADKRVVFAPVGTDSNGFTSSVIAVKDATNIKRNTRSIQPTTANYFIRLGERSLLEDIAKVLVIEDSVLVQVISKVRLAMENISTYLLTRVKLFPVQSVPPVEDIFERDLNQFLHLNSLGQESGIELLGSMCRTAGVEEGLASEKLTASSFGQLINAIDSGKFYPKGGARKLMESLAFVVGSSGGAVVRNVNIKNIQFEENEISGKFKATGVSLSCIGGKSYTVVTQNSVVSGVGILSTYSSFLPHQIISSETINKLITLTEARPKLKVVFWLDGTAEELAIKSTDYYETCGSLAMDSGSLNASDFSRVIKSPQEILHQSFVHLWSPSAQSMDQLNSKVQTIVVEFEAGENMTLLETYRGFNENNSSEAFFVGPKFYINPRDPASNPNDASFGETIGRPLYVSIQKQEQLLKRASAILYEVYPKTIDKILQSRLVIPSLGGRRLSENPEKYKAKLSATTEIDNFYLTGNDIALPGLMGELQSGWTTANAVLGYSPQELLEGSNIVTDLQSMLK